MRNTNDKETQPIEEIIQQLESNLAKQTELLRTSIKVFGFNSPTLPSNIDYNIEALISKAYSLGALRVVAKAADQAQILIEGRVK